jgi:hypothetical protein
MVTNTVHAMEEQAAAEVAVQQLMAREGAKGDEPVSKLLQSGKTVEQLLPVALSLLQLPVPELLRTAWKNGKPWALDDAASNRLQKVSRHISSFVECQDMTTAKHEATKRLMQMLLLSGERLGGQA